MYCYGRTTLKNFGPLRGSVVLDADGVWFSGREYRAVMSDGSVSIMKKRDFHDAQGLSFLRVLGLKVVFATGEGQPLDSIVEKINNLDSVKSGDWSPVDLFMGELKKGGKVASLEAWLEKSGISWSDCVYIGDDRTDLEAMQKIKENRGLVVVPQDATRMVKKLADMTLLNKGGKGAVREFAEMVLDARGIDEATLPAA